MFQGFEYMVRKEEVGVIRHRIIPKWLKLEIAAELEQIEKEIASDARAGRFGCVAALEEQRDTLHWILNLEDKE